MAPPSCRPDVDAHHHRAAGPRARDILGRCDLGRRSERRSKFGTCQTIEAGTLRVLASRISYVGDLGWKLYIPMDQGLRLWDIPLEGRQAPRAGPCGIGVYGTTGRLEKCYRAHGNELETEYNVVEAAWQRHA